MSSLGIGAVGAAISTPVVVQIFVRGGVDLKDFLVGGPLAWSDVLARQGNSKPRAPSADRTIAGARAGGIGGRRAGQDGVESYLDRVPKPRKSWDLQGQWKDALTGGGSKSNPFGAAATLDDVLSKVRSRKHGVGGSWARLPPRRPAGFDNRQFGD
ncbi:hypothetical protein F1559_001488 [Cyanidiococcus yangmingshanensis]|uniref:Uncharacterized protein n=1 Tax=Cyanidiococcus yangmingshanensis TaxID=2690220 RepID=A0A7J7IQF3_9RHOD|nr:hypothetical protein F1559_001488 [Cyanidiococcus yangmingshanensis]